VIDARQDIAVLLNSLTPALSDEIRSLTYRPPAPDVNRLLAESEKAVELRVEPVLRVVDIESPHKSPTDHGTSAPQEAQVLDIYGGDGWT
jgi:hypothetical protein